MIIDSFKKALLNLKRVLPLLLENKLAPHPLNYTLWYAYVSEVDKQLNADIDRISSEYGRFPEHLSETLYRKHILKESSRFEGFDDGLLSLTRRLCAQVDDLKVGSDRVLVGLRSHSQGTMNDDQTRSGFVDLSVEAIDLQASFKRMLTEAQDELLHLRQVMNDLSELDAIDAATGLYNRSAFEQDVSVLVRESSAIKLSLAVFAIDDFRECTDRCGKRLGDKLLMEVAAIVRQLKQENATIYRMGSGLIGLLMVNQNVLQARDLAEQVRFEVGRKVVTDRRTGRAIAAIKASVGVAQYSHGESAESLAYRAETALFQANSSGKSCVKMAG